MKIYKVLGKRGRVTIPFEIREDMGIGFNDILSFEQEDEDTIVIHREHLCGMCQPETPNAVAKPTNETTLLDFLNGLTPTEQRAALVHLSMKIAMLHRGDHDE